MYRPYLSRMSTKISFLCDPLFCPDPATGFCIEEDGAVFVLSDCNRPPPPRSKSRKDLLRRWDQQEPKRHRVSIVARNTPLLLLLSSALADHDSLPRTSTRSESPDSNAQTPGNRSEEDRTVQTTRCHQSMPQKASPPHKATITGEFHSDHAL